MKDEPQKAQNTQNTKNPMDTILENKESANVQLNRITDRLVDLTDRVTGTSPSSPEVMETPYEGRLGALDSQVRYQTALLEQLEEIAEHLQNNL